MLPDVLVQRDPHGPSAEPEGGVDFYWRHTDVLVRTLPRRSLDPSLARRIEAGAVAGGLWDGLASGLRPGLGLPTATRMETEPTSCRAPRPSPRECAVRVVRALGRGLVSYGFVRSTHPELRRFGATHSRGGSVVETDAEAGAADRPRPGGNVPPPPGEEKPNFIGFHQVPPPLCRRARASRNADAAACRVCKRPRGKEFGKVATRSAGAESRPIRWAGGSRRGRAGWRGRGCGSWSTSASCRPA